CIPEIGMLGCITIRSMIRKYLIFKPIMQLMLKRMHIGHAPGQTTRGCHTFKHRQYTRWPDVENCHQVSDQEFTIAGCAPVTTLMEIPPIPVRKFVHKAPAKTC